MASQLNVDVIVAETTADVQINDSLDVTGATDIDGATTLNSTLDVDGATTLNSTLDVDGATTLNGNVTLGNAITDTITPTGQVAADIDFATDNTNDIGGSVSTLRPRDVHVGRTATIGTSIELGHATDTSLTRSAAGRLAVEAIEVVLESDWNAKGDLMTATANDTVAIQTVGANGTILCAQSEQTNGLRYVAALRGVISGLTYDNGTDATNDININIGGAMDSTNAYWMTLSTALGKQSDVAWAVGGTVGAPAGGLDTGAVGNSDYYIWLIARSDTGVVDALFSLSSTAPSMPTGYDFRRLIGWFKRVGGTIVAFTTYEIAGGGLEMQWNSPTLDVNLAATLTTSRRTDAVKVPLNFSVEAHLNTYLEDAASETSWIYCPDQTDLAPSGTAAPLANIFASSAVGTGMSQLKIRTSATGLIAARSNTATIDQYRVSTMGFSWARRN